MYSYIGFLHRIHIRVIEQETPYCITGQRIPEQDIAVGYFHADIFRQTQHFFKQHTAIAVNRIMIDFSIAERF